MFRLIKLNFKSCIKIQKATHEITKRPFNDNIKYNSNNSIDGKKQHCDNKQKWTTLSLKDNEPVSLYKKRIITYGDGSFSRSMRGKLSAPTRRITNVIKKMSKNSQEKTEFIYDTEAFTNQTCNQCKIKSFANTISVGSKRKAYAVLKYNPCSTV